MTEEQAGPREGEDSPGTHEGKQEPRREEAGPDTQGNHRSPRKASRLRKLAEWVSLGVSLCLILGIAGFLLYETLRSSAPHPIVRTRLLHQEVKKVDGRFILPVEIQNRGERAIRLLRLEVSYTPPGGREETRELDVDYLGEKSGQTVYLYFDEDPKTLGVKAEPQFYFLE